MKVCSNYSRTENLLKKTPIQGTVSTVPPVGLRPALKKMLLPVMDICEQEEKFQQLD
jgi:hypothetical protein